MKKLLLSAALLFAFPLTSHAEMTPPDQMPAGIYTVDKTHASVTWKVSHMGLSNYTARFTSIDAELNFDPVKPENSVIKASVDPLSIRTDYPNAAEKDFDKELATGTMWFNGVAFPKITFESTKIEMIGDKSAKITGNLTLLGVTKPMTLDAVFNGAYIKKPFADVPGLGFSAIGTIKRSEFGMKTYIPNIGDDVQIIIEAEFHKAAL